MMTQSFEELVASMAAKTPTPGGGAAAAMAGCMGTSLFLMTVRFSQGKKANVDREGDLAAAESALSDHLEQLRPMAERDCAAFDLVSAAFRMSKESDEQKVARSAAIQESMVGAMLVPEETQKMILGVFVTMEAVRDCVGASIASDLASGAALLLAGAEGAYLNVRINAAELKDRALADATMARATAARDEIRGRQAAIAAQVDEMLS
ncbi:MAG: cyclodeaminase/cyclohydrolase family protein [Planctomycetota bacterium]|nr:cyclodeaminase/cyclohydrolase family protein [Planctomycetota bacterium]